jgi:hypothetical protein
LTLSILDEHAESTEFDDGKISAQSPRDRLGRRHQFIQRMKAR